MNGKTLLVEIGTEELPPKLLCSSAQLFCDNITTELNKFYLMYKKVVWFASPRRLAVQVIDLQTHQIDRTIQKRGPALKNAFDNKGQITEQTQKWINKNKLILSQVETLYTTKGKWLIFNKKIKSKKIQLLLPLMIEQAIKQISLSKSMRWGNGIIRFIRPIHTVTVLFGKELISCIILGIKSKRIIYGHRFMGESKITLIDADEYLQVILTRGKVIADYNKRKEIIKTGIESLAHKIGGKADITDELLDEVTSLVEWPVILHATFKKEFLNIPHKLLIHIMKKTQRYFPIYDDQGMLLSKFIFVSNIESSDSNQIIIGNEKVLNSRLVDAKFFFDYDRKKRLSNNLKYLNKVIFHKKLGSLRDKTKRITYLSKWIAIQIGANIKYSIRASLLSKCDLITSTVFEFTEMQGIMGMYYARYNGENEEIAFALSQQYKPCFSGDKIPSSLVGCVLSISDKMDTLVGIFGIKQFPKGSKDPLALRRAAFGILRIILERKLPLNLKLLAEKSVHIYKNVLTNKNTVNDILDFMFDRLQQLYLKNGYSLCVFKSVLSIRPLCPIDFDLRIKALSYFLTLQESNELIMSNKRVVHFLTKSNKISVYGDINLSLLKHKEEIELANHISKLTTELKPYIAQGLYKEALIELAKLKEAIDNFFNKVKININDTSVHINRLTLLSKLRFLFIQVADISLLK
ncbi:glycine--tRNA ligase subunit beta [Candidatus Pantoea edessiphila]|uniref:Glycine--tRNA ligase beta subunit n=1 Tax=Candidatus Pantoea edessiphila TaxID=2044610 RepID=A0A2P5SZD4_9GAMM|nr:glycine--tRNA ligase subunit beta [Candidatus Pantoea edessiphila]PPI87662.1 glycine--tRNA ligase subunit beta [Candidatus Pantoea edessiphila]